MSRAQLTSTVEQSSGGVVAPFLAGKNKIINGDFRIWQRGTSFSSPSATSYTSDRWLVNYDGSGAAATISQQTFTPGTAPVSGYESPYFWRWNQTSAGSGGSYNVLEQRIEDVRSLTGTVTISFWAKADTTRTVSASFNKYYGSGGSSSDYATNSTSFSLTTSWARYTSTVSLASLSGKTIGTGSYIGMRFDFPINTTFTIDIWGVQLEAGSVATPFTTASGTLQGELALCQRYYWRLNASAYSNLCQGGYEQSSTAYAAFVSTPVPLRVAPTSIDWANINLFDTNASTITISSPSLAAVNTQYATIAWTISGGTAQRFGWLRDAGSGTGYLGLSAEL
jgi:hypothetical protein